MIAREGGALFGNSNKRVMDENQEEEKPPRTLHNNRYCALDNQ